MSMSPRPSIPPALGVRGSAVLSAAGVAAAVMFGALLQFYGALASLDRIWLDSRFGNARSIEAPSQSNDPVIVGIDQEFLDSIDEPLALSHRYLGELLDVLAPARPAAVAVDLVLPSKSFDKLVLMDSPDQDFHRSLLKGLMNVSSVAPLILAKAWNQPRGRYEELHVDFQSVIELARDKGSRIASAMLCADPDQRVRRYPGSWCQADGSVPFSAEVSAAIGNRQEWDDGLINFGLGRELDYVSIARVLALSGQGGAGEIERLFQGRVVFVGVVLDYEDLHYVPVPLAQWRPNRTDIPGVVVHAQIFRSMMNHGFVIPLGFIACLPGIGAGALFWLRARQRTKGVLLVAFVIGTLAVSWVLFGYGFWLSPSAIIATALVAFGLRAGLDAWGLYAERHRLQQSFAGYVSPSVMEEIISGRLASKQCERRHLAVLFAGIRGFSTISEGDSPDDAVAMLVRYFDRMVGVIHRNGGTLDKFLGDGIMVLFGAPNPLDCPERSALECAHEMLLELGKLNCELAAESKSPIMIDIGIHAGEAIVGEIGAGDRTQYTAIGVTVDTAARLKAVCDETGYPIVCSDGVRLAVGSPVFLTDCGERAMPTLDSMRVFGWNPVATGNAWPV